MTEASLMRILDREGLYWDYPGDDTDDPNQARWVELRIDARADGVAEARKVLESEGWTVASQPYEADDPIQRLYFRKFQSIGEEEREAMLIAGYKAAVASSGTFWSWVNLNEGQPT